MSKPRSRKKVVSPPRPNVVDALTGMFTYFAGHYLAEKGARYGAELRAQKTRCSFRPPCAGGPVDQAALCARASSRTCSKEPTFDYEDYDT